MYKVEIQAGDLPLRTVEVEFKSNAMDAIRNEVHSVLLNWLMGAERTLERFRQVADTLHFFERDMEWAEDNEMKEHLNGRGEWGYSLKHRDKEMHFNVIKIKE